MTDGHVAAQLVSALIKASDTDKVDQSHWTCSWSDSARGRGGGGSNDARSGVLVVTGARVFRTFNASYYSGTSVKWTLPATRDSRGTNEHVTIARGKFLVAVGLVRFWGTFRERPRDLTHERHGDAEGRLYKFKESGRTGPRSGSSNYGVLVASSITWALEGRRAFPELPTLRSVVFQ
jgi:hypothetical protein